MVEWLLNPVALATKPKGIVMLGCGRSTTLLKLALPAVLVACGGSNSPDTPDPEPHAAILTAEGNSIMHRDPTGHDTLTILTEANTYYSNLQPQPGGTILFFVRFQPSVGSGLYRMTTHGGSVSPVAAPGVEPFWSADGTRIAWVAATDTGSVVVLTLPDLSAPDTICLAEWVGWAPDGHSLVITYRPTNQDPEVGTIALTGGAQRVNLSNSPNDDLYPVWSPDGASIAFYSARSPQPGIYVMRADGSDQKFLLSATIFQAPKWSPDGSRVAVIDYGTSPVPIGLRIVRTDGTEEILPDSLATGATGFDWSPTGAHALVVHRPPSGAQVSYLTTGSVTSATRLPTASGIAEAVWVAEP
jgi:Tol biopolymer transport system component